jgi:uncharacterized pyridoxal phosphate-containing UPF0001 family protein
MDFSARQGMSDELNSSMDFANKLEAIQNEINAACHGAARDPASVILLAASKSQPPGHVRAVAELGVTWFGENRVQEARIKIGQCPGRLHW